MPVALAAKAPASFEIKSANLPLVALLVKSAAMDTLAAEMAERYGDIPDFFDNDPLLIDLAPLAAADPQAELDFAALLALLRRHRLAPLAVRGGSAAQMQAAQAAGLAPAPDARVAAPVAPAAEPQPAAAPLPAEAEAPPLPPSSALVIDRPLRSGQQVYARGRDAVVLAMVNPGAELIADGHIHVYAPLRGRVIAGARGDTSARIFALDMRPELISIAGVYRTTETPLAPEVWGRAAQIHLASGEAGDKLIVTPLAS
ncbi:septum site-determining protein MinC [Comamonadaceae bacterium OH2545_COT-014]|nr:septum site-determining protein MinC [Comamonadaceae bacterium OH2545_COT-014]